MNLICLHSINLLWVLHVYNYLSCRIRRAFVTPSLVFIPPMCHRPNTLMSRILFIIVIFFYSCSYFDPNIPNFSGIDSNCTQVILHFHFSFTCMLVTQKLHSQNGGTNGSDCYINLNHLTIYLVNMLTVFNQTAEPD
jgi:hypothetical protein